MGKKARLDAVVNYARREHDKTLRKKPSLSKPLSYRWGHTLRVVQRGIDLAKKENADIEEVMVACLLHDIAKLGDLEHGLEHGRLGARKVRPILKEIGYSKKQIDNICYAIAWHVDGKAGFSYEHTLEADILNDADKIDRFSTYRTMLKLKSNAKSYRNYLRTVRSQLNVLLKYKQYPPTRTASGTKIFSKQLDLQIAFLERVLEDNDLTVLPKF